MAATDNFASLTGLSYAAPASSAVAVTPSDSTALSYVTRWVYVGGTGTLTVIMADGTTCEFQGIPAGTLLPIRVSQVKATGTSATLIVAMW